MSKVVSSEEPRCKNTGIGIMRFFNIHRGGDVVLVKRLALKRFPITEQEYDLWLGQWRFGK